MRGVSYPAALRAQAVALRQAGYSLNEIRKALGTPTLISKATVAGWVRHVQLTDAQRRRIQVMAGELAARGRANATLAWQRKIQLWKDSIWQRVDHLHPLPFQHSDVGKLACGLLYVCEGSKYPSSRMLTFGNADPAMIHLFLDLLRRYFHIDEAKFRVRIMHRWDQDGGQLIRFWSKVTQIPGRQFYPAYRDQRTKGQRTRRSDYRGVCAVHYFDTTLQYTLQSIGEGVMGYAVNRSNMSYVQADRVGEASPPPYRTEPTLVVPSIN